MKSNRKGKFKHYGSQTSKETLRRSGKYIPPEKSNPFKEIPTIYKPYYLLEKRVLEPVDAWISKQAFFTILGRLGNLAIVVAVVTFVFGEDVKRNNEVFTAWQTITSAQEQPGSGGRKEALEFLNSRPLRFPWIGWTQEELFWDKLERKCKLKPLPGWRWKVKPLVGLSAPNAYLGGIRLCQANLSSANLEKAKLFQAHLNKTNLSYANLTDTYLDNTNLKGANLKGANLKEANLKEAQSLTPRQVKSACYWEDALFDPEFQEKLKKEPDQEVDCSYWEKEN